MKKSKRIMSLRFRFILVLFTTAIILSFVTITGTYLIYSNALSFRYEALCKTVSETIAGSVDADKINSWLSGQNTREYIETNNMLRQLSKDVSDLDSVIIYQMKSDGMHTVFDMDSTNVRGGIGDVIDYDTKWGAHKQAFLASKEVGSIIVNGNNGRILMYCVPIFDSKSNCVGYACSGVAVEMMEGQQVAFFDKYSGLLFAIALLIALIATVIIERRVISPLGKICLITKKATNLNNFEYIKKITALKIHTGDEIENIWRSIIKIYTDKVQLMSVMQKVQENTALTYVTLIKRIDGYTADHIDNALQYVIILTDALRKKEKYKYVITDSVYSNIVHAAPLHDIGKLSVPDYILKKPAKLTDEEFRIMKEHTVYGAKLIEETSKNVQDAEYLELARQLSESHHERWDGKGYPYGLKGTEIPLAVRIIAVADVFDALVSKRCYKKEFSFEKAYSIILEESGTHFDPDIVETFVEIKDEIYNVYSKIAVEE